MLHTCNTDVYPAHVLYGEIQASDICSYNSKTCDNIPHMCDTNYPCRDLYKWTISFVRLYKNNQ